MFERARGSALPSRQGRAHVAAGLVGELHPTRARRERGAASSSTSTTLFAASREPVTYDDVITYPAVRQDLAVVVGEDVEAGALVAAAREAAGAELREMRVFDVYRGEQVPRRPEVDRVLGRVPVARADARRRGRGAPARRDRRRARRALRRRAARVASTAPGTSGLALLLVRLSRRRARGATSGRSGRARCRHPARRGCCCGGAGRPSSQRRHAVPVAATIGITFGHGPSASSGARVPRAGRRRLSPAPPARTGSA